MQNVNKDALVHEIMEKTELAKKDVESMLECLIDVVTDQLRKGNKVTLTGFGCDFGDHGDCLCISCFNRVFRESAVAESVLVFRGNLFGCRSLCGDEYVLLFLDRICHRVLRHGRYFQCRNLDCRHWC